MPFSCQKESCRAYENLTNAERCLVELYKKYLSHVPKEISDDTFYLRALPKLREKVWHYNKPLGRETLPNVVKKIMIKAAFEGHFTNHSRKRSSATYTKAVY